jgi:hypothetical protein
MDVIVCTAGVGNVLRTSVCTSPTALEAEVLGSGLEFVIIIRFRRWIRRKCLSSRCDVTRDLPLHGLSFVLSVCRRRIISLEIVILDTSKWSARLMSHSSLNHAHRSLTVILTEPWHRRSCENFQNGELFTFVDITIKYQSTKETIKWFKKIYIFMLTPKLLFVIIYVNVCVKRAYPHKTNNNILFRHGKIQECQFSVPWSSLRWSN